MTKPKAHAPLHVWLACSRFMQSWTRRLHSLSWPAMHTLMARVLGSAEQWLTFLSLPPLATRGWAVATPSANSASAVWPTSVRSGTDSNADASACAQE